MSLWMVSHYSQEDEKWVTPIFWDTQEQALQDVEERLEQTRMVKIVEVP